MKYRKLVVVGGIVIAAVLVGTVAVASGDGQTLWGAASGPPQCRLNDAPSDVEGGIHDVSSSGEYFLSGHYPTGEDSLLWRDGAKSLDVSSSVVAAKLGYDDTNGNEPAAVNSSGVVAGVYETGHAADPEIFEGPHREELIRDVAWVYRDGEFTELKLPEELEDAAGKRRGLVVTDLGDDGTVTGFLHPGATAMTPENYLDEGPGVVPLTWKPNASEATVLDHESGTLTYATAAHDDGSVIGIELKPTDSGKYLSQGPHTVWKWGLDGKREKLPFGDVSFDATELDGSEFPMVAGDWVLVHNQRWKMGDQGAPRETRLSPDDGDMFIDEHGYVYGTIGEGKPRMEIDRKFHSLSVGDADDSPDDSSEYVGTLLDGVSANGQVIVGAHERVPTSPDADFVLVPEYAIWRCDYGG